MSSSHRIVTGATPRRATRTSAPSSTDHAFATSTPTTHTATVRAARRRRAAVWTARSKIRSVGSRARARETCRRARSEETPTALTSPSGPRSESARSARSEPSRSTVWARPRTMRSGARNRHQSSQRQPSARRTLAKIARAEPTRALVVPFRASRNESTPMNARRIAVMRRRHAPVAARHPSASCSSGCVKRGTTLVTRTTRRRRARRRRRPRLHRWRPARNPVREGRRESAREGRRKRQDARKRREGAWERRRKDEWGW